MHLIVPFAAPLPEAGRAAMRALRWPALAPQLALSTIDAPALAGVADAELSLSTPAERALAGALDWDVADGLVPLARLAARADGVALGGPPIALLTPVHWHLGTEQIGMTDPESLGLDEAASRELLAAVSGLFTSEGYALHWGAPTRWFVEHESLAALPSASLDRVIGRNVDRWLTTDAASRRLRRLQSEAQMLLHAHPLNAERERRGLLPVNSFWLSGGGPALPLPALLPQFETALRRAALAEDWAAWRTEWALLDERLANTPWTRLTLCGERGSRSFGRTPAGAAATALRRALRGWRRANLGVLLEGL
jgi:hypothetical protein